MKAGQAIERRTLQVVIGRLAEEPVVVLQGPRTVGKTYLLNELAARCRTEVIDLDDPPTLDALRADPSTFVAGPSPVLIDEYQHEPSVLAAIKAELNKDLRPGRFVLTGSTRSAMVPEVARFLAGRVNLLPVLPFSQGEIAAVRENFVEALLFGEPGNLVTPAKSTTDRKDYAERIICGGMPIAITRSAASRSRWLDDYVNIVLQRNAAEIAQLRQRHQLPLLLRYLAARSAQLLNVTAAAQAISLDRHTTADYLSLLEALFVVRQLPAWGRTLGTRTSGAPKVHLVDSGVAARLLHLTSEHLDRRDPASLTEFGHLLETFVVGEISKQTSWLDGVAGLHHWRTYDGDEVDLVVERDDGAIVGIEVKSGTRVLGKDLRAIEKLRDLAGTAFLAGVIIYTGERSYRLGHDMFVLPVDRLWTPVGS